MTTSYDGLHFKEPQFLVFSNRLGALVISSICLRSMGPSPQRQSESGGIEAASEVQEEPPLTSYANPALSNILSSWCQYEALLFITFPVQVSFF